MKCVFLLIVLIIMVWLYRIKCAPISMKLESANNSNSSLRWGLEHDQMITVELNNEGNGITRSIPGAQGSNEVKIPTILLEKSEGNNSARLRRAPNYEQGTTPQTTGEDEQNLTALTKVPTGTKFGKVVIIFGAIMGTYVFFVCCIMGCFHSMQRNLER